MNDTWPRSKFLRNLDSFQYVRADRFEISRVSSPEFPPFRPKRFQYFQLLPDLQISLPTSSHSYINILSLEIEIVSSMGDEREGVLFIAIHRTLDRGRVAMET